MDLLLATNNAHKAKEIKSILNGKFDNIYTLKEKNICAEPEETGATFFENALIKAKAISKLTDLPVLSDDSGLSVAFLGGAPGVFSARYAGTDADDAQNNLKLLEELKNADDRRACFQCCVVLLFKDGSYVFGEGKTEGEILKERAGSNGFGYDPYFFSYDLKKSFAEATESEKNSVSHRCRALSDLLSYNDV
jgi:XTP/dITP diphosphohydrolase